MSNRPGVQEVFRSGPPEKVTVDFRILAPAHADVEVLKNEARYTYLALLEKIEKQWGR